MNVRQDTEGNDIGPVKDKWFRSPKSGVPSAIAVAEQEDIKNGAYFYCLRKCSRNLQNLRKRLYIYITYTCLPLRLVNYNNYLIGFPFHARVVGGCCRAKIPTCSACSQKKSLKQYCEQNPSECSGSYDDFCQKQPKTHGCPDYCRENPTFRVCSGNSKRFPSH